MEDYKLDIKFNTEEDFWEIKVSGEIDVFNSNDFKTKLLEAVDKKEKDLRIDCEGLRYIDSTALGSLFMVSKRVGSYNGSVYLLKLGSNLYKLFKITNLDKVFIIEGVAND